MPRDSTLRIRPRSALGLKYVEVDEGHEQGDVRATATPCRPRRLGFSTELDEVYEMFDEPTRKAAQENLRGFGDAFAGRGQAVGRTLEELPPLHASRSSR